MFNLPDQDDPPLKTTQILFKKMGLFFMWGPHPPGSSFLNKIGIVFQEGSSSSWCLIWKPPKKEITPGKGFLAIKLSTDNINFCTWSLPVESTSLRRLRHPVWSQELFLFFHFRFALEITAFRNGLLLSLSLYYGVFYLVGRTLQSSP